jgi:uncharacterized protein (UPF0332 family)
MSLSDELLDTAKYLLRRNKNKPTQADIRRSISTAYYALFHRLIEAGTGHLVADLAQQQALARTFSHTSMREICELVVKQPLPTILVPLLGSSASNELTRVANTFVALQDWRHNADYNVNLNFIREEGRERVDEVEDVFAAWKLIPTSIANPFLILLLIGKRSLR